MSGSGFHNVLFCVLSNEFIQWPTFRHRSEKLCLRMADGDANVILRLIQESELKTVESWCIDEGWSLREQDLGVFLAVQPDGFFVAEANGELAGCAFAARFGPNNKFGTLGVFIVDKKLRGKGIGKVLLNAANKFLHIDDSDVIAGLSGRKDVVPVYIRSGYKNVVWDVLVYEGQVHLEKLTTTTLDAIDVVPVSSVKFEDLLKYDQCIHPGVNRSLYWTKCFAKKGTEYLVAVNDGNIVGMCGCRPFTPERVYITPLYADSLDIAKVLIKALLEKVRPSSVQMEAIEPNPLNKELSAWLGVSVSYALARQYTSEEGLASYDKVYAIAESDIYFV